MSQEVPAQQYYTYEERDTTARTLLLKNLLQKSRNKNSIKVSVPIPSAMPSVYAELNKQKVTRERKVDSTQSYSAPKKNNMNTN